MRVSTLTSLIVCGALALGATDKADAAPERFVIDPEHVTVAFTVMHIGYARVVAIFHNVEGSFTYDPDTSEISDLEVVIEAASVETRQAARDGHVRSGDFLDAEANPEITFVGTDAEADSPTTGRLTGDLTVRGVTVPVTLEVTLNKIGPYPYGPNFVIGASARATLSRSDWGMTYGVANGLVGDQVDVMIELEAIRQ